MTPALRRGDRRRYVLDANALVGLIEGRAPIATKIDHLIEEAIDRDLPLWMSAVTWGEVFYVAWRRHGEGKAREVEARLQEMPITVVGVDRDRATRAAALKQKHGMGYADAFAAELAIERGAWLVTADPEFSKIGKALLLSSLPRYQK